MPVPWMESSHVTLFSQLCESTSLNSSKPQLPYL
jgi:hypothetical protein